MPNTVSVTVLGKRTRSESSKTLTDDSLELQPWKIQRRGSTSSHRLGSSRSSSTLIGSEASNADLDFAPFYLDNNEDSVNLVRFRKRTYMIIIKIQWRRSDAQF